MNKETLLKEPDSKDYEAPFPELAISVSNEPKCNDAQPRLDPESMKRFCQVWGEIGRAILNRRDKVDFSQGKTRFDYTRGCVHQSI